VTVRVPLAVLNRVDAEAFEWHVPGLREELVTELIRGLPKNLRRNFVPAPDVAREVVKRLRAGDGSLLDALSHELLRMSGVAVPRDAWQPQRLPAHLRTTFRVEDPGGEPLAEGKDLPALKKQLAQRMSDALSAAAKGVERAGLRGWDFGEVPRTFAHDIGGHVVRGYPALVDEGDSVAIRVLPTEDEQRESMWRGTRRLLLLAVPSPVKAVLHRLPNDAKLALRWYPYATATELFDDCVTAALVAVIEAGGGPAWDAAGFARLRDAARRDLAEVTYDVVTVVRRILVAARAVDALLADPSARAFPHAVTDVRAQLERLVGKGFVTATGTRQLPHVERYLRAAERRLQRVALDPERDRLRTRHVGEIEAEYELLLRKLPPAVARSPKARAIRWMLDELRVSLFAQVIGTPYPISEKRVYAAMSELDG
jgi:ATP-dependent helicase HrpA